MTDPARRRAPDARCASAEIGNGSKVDGAASERMLNGASVASMSLNAMKSTACIAPSCRGGTMGWSLHASSSWPRLRLIQPAIHS
jgi:hypothetical protein